MPDEILATLQRRQIVTVGGLKKVVPMLTAEQIQRYIVGLRYLYGDCPVDIDRFRSQPDDSEIGREWDLSRAAAESFMLAIGEA